MIDKFSDYGRLPRFQPGQWILPGIAAVVLLFDLLANAAFAQSQEASPTFQALSQRLMGEINTNLQCSTNLIELQAKLTKETAELTALKEKYAKAPGASQGDAKDEPVKKQDKVPMPPEKK